jgi:hypothetical protein
MSITDGQRTPNSASAMSVAAIAQERAGKLYQEVILRDALILDLQAQVDALQAQLRGEAPAAG